MKVCTNCGHENSDDAQFCESCREFLWGDRKAVDEKEQAPPSPAANGDGAGAPAVAAEPPEGPASVESEPVVAPEQTPPIAPATEAIPPGKEHEAPPPVPPSFDEPEPGELICDQCGTGNRAIARFCRRCGASLAGARVAKRPSWWRRLVWWLTRRRSYSAGERRRRQTTVRTTAQKARRGVFHITRTVALLSVLGVAVIGAWRADAVNLAGDEAHRARAWLFPRYEPAHPTQTRATSHLGGHEAAAAFDGNLSTSWAEGAPGDGRGQTLVARFHRVIHVSRIGFTLGNQTKPQSFLKEPVPKRVRVAFFDRYGRHLATTRFDLAHEADFQRYSIDVPNVTKVVVTIALVFHTRVGHANSITEIEFFEKN